MLQEMFTLVYGVVNFGLLGFGVWVFFKARREFVRAHEEKHQSKPPIAGGSGDVPTSRRRPVVYTAPDGRKIIGFAELPPGGGKRWAFEAFGLEPFRPRIARLTF